MITPKKSFFGGEGRLLRALLWGVSALFIGIMVWAWVASVRARPVLLDLETGRPVDQSPTH